VGGNERTKKEIHSNVPLTPTLSHKGRESRLKTRKYMQKGKG